MNRNGPQVKSSDADLETAKKEYIDAELSTGSDIRKNPTFEENGQIKNLNPEDYTEEKIRTKAERDWNRLNAKQKQEYDDLYVGEDAAAASAAKRSDALDELGAYDFSKSVDLDNPKLGVHDMFDWDESGIRSVDDMGIVGAVFDQYRISNNSRHLLWTSRKRCIRLLP